MDEYQDVIEQLKNQKPEALIVFGSYAWGKPHKDSDLDIMMVKKTAVRSHIERIRQAHRPLRTSCAVDVLVLTPEEAKIYQKKYSFYRDIFENGKLIYGRV